MIEREDTDGAEVRCVIGVLTYRRPDDLAELLPLLVTQTLALQDHGVVAEVLVVDNDPDGSARGLIGNDPSVRYVHEPRPGIAAARNKALDESVGARLLAFIDDDERPSPGWLASLIEVWLQSSPAAVAGPVVSAYRVEPDAWVSAGRFFERRRMETGHRIEVAATNNLLLDLQVVRELGLRFDDRFGLTGGSDSVFTRALHLAGKTMLWCDEAVVTDVVPPSRLTRRWVLQKAYRIGNTWSRIELDGVTGAARLIRILPLAARGTVRLGGGVIRYAAGLVSGRLDHRARGLRTAVRGAGMLTGSLGSVYAEYRRT